MFFQFANWNSNAPPGPPSLTMIQDLIRVHPTALIQALEQFFSTRTAIPGYPNYAIPVIPAGYGAPNLETNVNAAPADQRWEHLIYSYMIENTRIFEIFDRILHEYEMGERFETPDPDTALWLRTTEALFYRELNSGFIGALTSAIRPDPRAIRRNAYYRLLGIDLNHGMDGNRPYSFEKPAAANRDFVPTLETFVREVWRGAINASNSSGANETDNAVIANLARDLNNMLTLRRRNGNIVREEFWAVATMSWLDLAVAEDTPIVRALKSEGSSKHDRITKLGQRVGVPAHANADAYFNLALPLSSVLTFIETNPAAVQTASAPGYYNPAGPFPLIAADMRTINNYWSKATGRDLKAVSVTASARAPMALRNAPAIEVRR